jgi:hypothetical protein
MNDNQPKCFDYIGPKTKARLLHRLRVDNNNAKDPREIILSGVGEQEINGGLAEWLGYIKDYTFERHNKDNNVIVKGWNTNPQSVGKWVNIETGEEMPSTPRIHHLQDFRLNYFVHNDARVCEPLANKTTAKALANFILNHIKPVTIVNFDGDLKYLPELLNFRDKSKQPLDVEICNLREMYEGEPVEGVIPHREYVSGTGWAKETFTYSELTEEQPEELIEHLLPEKALTILSAPSYTGKTHIAIEMGLVLATGENFLGHFQGPGEPVPVIYHVPELHSALFKQFLDRLNAAERLQGIEDRFRVRPLEFDLWQLDSPKMIESSRGRYVFLDTFGYFNDADDTSNYNQAILFCKKINNLVREGCLGVCGLYHPPKYSKDKKATGNIMTLENLILGSAGYGGVLRSCLGMRNLHDDSNKGLWVYVQGVKNPGLGGPFQIQGVSPMMLIKKPGESPYLSELLKGNSSKREQALAMLQEGKSRDAICKELKVSARDVSAWKHASMFDSNEGEESNDNTE